MNWEPESEKEDSRLGRAIMRREELERMAVAFVIGFIEKEHDAPVAAGWDAAEYVQQKLDKVAPVDLP